MATLKNTRINTDQAIKLPTGTSSQRPSSPSLGMMRYNTEEEIVEVYNGEEWIQAFAQQGAGLPFTVGFEEGTFIPQWTRTTNFNVVSSPTNTGNFAAGTDGNTIDAVLDIDALVGAQQFSQLEFYWWERRAQSGFTVNFEDSSGNPVFDCGGNNPQWEINDASGNTQVGRTNVYETWVFYKFTFDWPNNQYTYFYQETTDTGNTASATRTLFRNTNIATMKINNSIWGSASSMYFDDIKFS